MGRGKGRKSNPCPACEHFHVKIQGMLSKHPYITIINTVIMLVATSSLLWTSSPSDLPQKDNNLEVAAVRLSPDGTRLVAAIATRVLLYDTATGTLLSTLKAHKMGIVSDVDWSPDGTRFVSGDVEGKVIIWTGAGEGLLKYSHSRHATVGEDSPMGVKQLSHNPIMHQLCSIADLEFALWSPGQKAVVKKKVSHIIARVAWRGDGQCMALGFANGEVSLRECTSWAEIGKIMCQPCMDVMTWMASDVLVVGKKQTLTVYHNGIKCPKNISLDSIVLEAQHAPRLKATLLLLQDGNVLLFRDEDSPAQAIYQSDKSSSPVTMAIALDRLALGSAEGIISLVRILSSSQQLAPCLIKDGWQAKVDSQIANGDLTLAFATLQERGSPLSLSSSSSSQPSIYWEDQVLAVARAAQDPELVRMCGSLLAEIPHISSPSIINDKEASIRRGRALREIFLSKLQDVSLLMVYYIRQKMWAEALALAEEKAGLFDPSTFLPYAQWLLTENPQRNFDEAMSFYYCYDSAAQGRILVEVLVRNAVVEGRFQDASYYCWVLAVDAFHLVGSNETSDGSYEKEYNRLSTLADVYGAFQHIHAYTQEPFTTLSPLALFQVARFVLNTLGSGEPPFGISKIATLYTITKQAQILGARIFACSCYSKLLTLNLPSSWRDAVEVGMLHLQAVPQADEGKEEEELHPVCYQCGHINPFINPANQFVKESLIVRGGRADKNEKLSEAPVEVSGARGSISNCSRSSSNKKSTNGDEWAGDVCVRCGHPFIRSMLGFEVLPLVEFMPDQALSDEEVVALLQTEPLMNTSSAGGGMHISSPSTMLAVPPTAVKRVERSYIPVMVDTSTLQALRAEEVFVCRPVASSGAHEMFMKRRRKKDKKKSIPDNCTSNTCLRSRFFRNVLYPDIPLALSQPAQRFSPEEHFEMAYLWATATATSSVTQQDRNNIEEERKMGVPTCPFSRVRDLGEYGPLA